MENPGPSSAPLISDDPSQRYQRGLNTLKDTQRMVDDSERVGTHILGALHDQRGQLEDAREQNENIDTSLQRSNRMIRRMFYRAFTIKVGLGCFALLLVVAIAVIVYLKWIANLINGNSPPPQPPSPPSPAASPATAPARRLSEERDAALGDGLIALVAIGAVFLLACCAARASAPATKCGVICSLSCVYLVIVLFLVLLPKKDYSEDDSELEKLSDVTDLLRIVLGIVLGLCAIIGPLLVLVAHVLPVQKSPVIHDDSCEELAPAVA